MMFFLIIIFVGAVALEEKTAVLICDEMNNILTSSELSVTSFDFPKAADTVNISRNELDGMVWYDFEEIYRDLTLCINAVTAHEDIIRLLEKNIEETAIFKNKRLDYRIDEMIIYNVSTDMVIHNYIGDNYNIDIIKDYKTKALVKSPNGVDIIHSAVYVKLSFSYTGLFNRRHTIALEKCILLKYC